MLAKDFAMRAHLIRNAVEQLKSCESYQRLQASCLKVAV